MKNDYINTAASYSAFQITECGCTVPLELLNLSGSKRYKEVLGCTKLLANRKPIPRKYNSLGLLQSNCALRKQILFSRIQEIKVKWCLHMTGCTWHTIVLTVSITKTLDFLLNSL